MVDLNYLGLEPVIIYNKYNKIYCINTGSITLHQLGLAPVTVNLVRVVTLGRVNLYSLDIVTYLVDSSVWFLIN